MLLKRTYKKIIPKSIRDRTYKVRESVQMTFKSFPARLFFSKNYDLRNLKEALYYLHEVEEKHKSLLDRVVSEQETHASYESLKKYKTSDTIYLLGSSSSLNDLTKEQWDKVKKADSIGFNFFIAHDFVPTFYHTEILPEVFNFYEKAYALKGNDFKKVPFIINIKHCNPGRTLDDYSFVENKYFTVPYFIDRKEYLRPFLSFFYSKNFKKNNFYVHYRGSVSLMISLSVLLGYKRIILLGIDLTDLKYFFHDKEIHNSEIASLARKQHKDMLSLHGKQGKQNEIHSTMDTSLWTEHLTIDKYIYLYNEVLSEKTSSSLYVGSKHSRLTEGLEYIHI